MWLLCLAACSRFPCWRSSPPPFPCALLQDVSAASPCKVQHAKEGIARMAARPMCATAISDPTWEPMTSSTPSRSLAVVCSVRISVTEPTHGSACSAASSCCPGSCPCSSPVLLQPAATCRRRWVTRVAKVLRQWVQASLLVKMSFHGRYDAAAW